jgi:hypothetical protein
MSSDLEQTRSALIATVVLLVTVMLLIGTIFLTTSCTLNMIMTHTEGSASDVVDSNPSTKADVSPDISVPVVP